MVSLSSNNNNNVNITTNNQGSTRITSSNTNDVTANTNGNSQRAKSWAVGVGLIDGVDYSAKYYANQAKEIEQGIAAETDEARIWAEGTDEEVEALGGTHSSKGWVDYVLTNPPTASVTQIDTGATITVTDVNGTTTADINNGADGQDGISPTATVTKSGSTATITITDKNGTTTTAISDGTNGTDGAAATISVGTTSTGAAGTSASVTNSGTSSAAVFNFTIPKGDKGDKGNTGNTGATGNGISSIAKTSTSGLVDTYTITYTNTNTDTFTVTNGQNGTNGTNGTDGYSPTATVTKSGTVATITITDKNGTTTANVYDGSGSITDVKVNNTSVVTSGVANIDLSGYALSNSLATVATSGSYNDLSNKPTIPTVPTNISAFTNDSGYITGISSSDVTTALGYTPYSDANPNGYTSNVGTVTSVNNVGPVNGNVTLSIPTDTNDLTNGAGYVTSSDFKTINNTSVLGSGNIDTSEIFLAEYNVTEFDDIVEAYNAGKTIFCKTSNKICPMVLYQPTPNIGKCYFSTVSGAISTIVKVYLSGDDTYWDTIEVTAADNTLSNVSSIDSGSVVYTELAGKADTDLSNLTSTGKGVIDGQWVYDLHDIVGSSTTMTNTWKNEYDVSTYLPNDSYTYEVMVSVVGNTPSSTGGQFDLRIGSDIIKDSNGDAIVYIAREQTRTNSTCSTVGTVTIPVGSGRKIKLLSGGTGSLLLCRAFGYRRLGTNT